MKVFTRLMIAAVALATPIFIAAQSTPAPSSGDQGPGMEQKQRRGPGMGMQRGMGMHEGMGMGMHEGMGMRGHRGMKMRHNAGMMMNHILNDPAMRERLKITPDQVEKFQAHQSTMAKAMVRSRADMQVKRMELAELMRADKPDRMLIDKKLREVQDASFAAQKAAINSHLDMQEMFTPEQRQEMEKMRGEFRGQMMQRGPEGQGQGGMRGPRGQRQMGPPKPPPAQNPPPTDNNR